MAMDNKMSCNGMQPPSAGVSNKHDGEGNPDMGEKMDHPMPTHGNKFPHHKGSDSMTQETAQLGP